MWSLLVASAFAARTVHLGPAAEGRAVVVVTLTESWGGTPGRSVEDRWTLVVGADGPALRDEDGTSRLPREWSPGLAAEGGGSGGPGAAAGGDGDGERATRAAWEAFAGEWVGSDWKVGEVRRAITHAAAPPLGWRVVPVHEEAAMVASPRARRAAPTTAELLLVRRYDPEEARRSLEALRLQSPELAGTAPVRRAEMADRWLVSLDLGPTEDGERALRPTRVTLDRSVRVELEEGGRADRAVRVEFSFRWEE